MSASQTLHILDNRTVRGVIFLLTFSISFLYFIQVTKVSGRGSELHSLTRKQAVLSEETHRIELFIAEESSAQNLQKRVSDLGLVSAGHIEYLKTPENSVALK